MTKNHRTAVLVDARVDDYNYRERIIRFAQSTNGKNIKVDFFYVDEKNNAVVLQQGTPSDPDPSWLGESYHLTFEGCIRRLVQMGYDLVLPAYGAARPLFIEDLSESVFLAPEPEVDDEDDENDDDDKPQNFWG